MGVEKARSWNNRDSHRFWTFAPVSHKLLPLQILTIYTFRIQNAALIIFLYIIKYYLNRLNMTREIFSCLFNKIAKVLEAINGFTKKAK